MNWPYVAGFFDGEGSISIASRPGQKYGSFRFCVSLSQNDGEHEVLEKISSFLASSGVDPGTKNSAPGKASRITISGSSAVLFLKSVMPWIVVKKVRAQDAIRLNTLYPSMRGKLAIQVREEKRKPKPMRVGINHGIPVGLCQCGCGQPTKIAAKNHKTAGHIKGVPVRFLRNHDKRNSYTGGMYV